MGKAIVSIVCIIIIFFGGMTIQLLVITPAASPNSSNISQMQKFEAKSTPLSPNVTTENPSTSQVQNLNHKLFKMLYGGCHNY